MNEGKLCDFYDSNNINGAGNALHLLKRKTPTLTHSHFFPDFSDHWKGFSDRGSINIKRE